jgi:hypothetical protein
MEFSNLISGQKLFSNNIKLLLIICQIILIAFNLIIISFAIVVKLKDRLVQKIQFLEMLENLMIFIAALVVN